MSPSASVKPDGVAVTVSFVLGAIALEGVIATVPATGGELAAVTETSKKSLLVWPPVNEKPPVTRCIPVPTAVGVYVREQLAVVLFPEVVQVADGVKAPDPLLLNVTTRPDAGWPLEPFPIVPVHVVPTPVVTDAGEQITSIVWLAATYGPTKGPPQPTGSAPAGRDRVRRRIGERAVEVQAAVAGLLARADRLGVLRQPRHDHAVRRARRPP